MIQPRQLDFFFIEIIMPT